MNIKQLAEIIGVSSATISRVLNNSGYVSEEKRRLVLEGIKKYNYIPNDIARSLSTKKTRSIGVIIPDIENPFFSSIISGINLVARESNYNLYFICSYENIDIEHDILDYIQKLMLDGVIITPVKEDDKITCEKLEQLNKKGVSIVLIDRDVVSDVYDGIFVDNFQATYDAIKILVDAGHEKISIITGPLTSKPGKERLDGYKKALRDNNIEVREEYIIEGDFRTERAYKCTEYLLSLKESPTAIFTSNNFTTIGCLKYLKEKNLQLGRDISVIGFDDIELLNILDYRLSVVYRDFENIGEESMNLIIDKIDKNDNRIVRKNVPYNIILRGSEKITEVSD